MVKALVKRPWGVHAVVDGKVVERSFWWGRGFVDFAMKYAGVMSTWWRVPNLRHVKPLYDENGLLIEPLALWPIFRRDWNGSAPAGVARAECAVRGGHRAVFLGCLVAAVACHLAYVCLCLETFKGLTFVLAIQAFWAVGFWVRVVRFYGACLALHESRIFYRDIQSIYVRQRFPKMLVRVVHIEGEHTVELYPWHFLSFCRGVKLGMASSELHCFETLVSSEEGA